MRDAVVDYMPAPDEVEAVRGIKDDETEDTRSAVDSAPFAALAFKIATDPFVGTLTFFRVYSGVLNGGDSVLNSVRGKKERVGRIQEERQFSQRRMDSAFADLKAAGRIRESGQSSLFSF